MHGVRSEIQRCCAWIEKFQIHGFDYNFIVNNEIIDPILNPFITYLHFSFIKLIGFQMTQLLGNLKFIIFNMKYYINMK